MGTTNLGNQILVINSGSSSMKLSLFSIDGEKKDVSTQIQAHIKGIDTPNPIFEISANGSTNTRECPHIPDLNSALGWVIETLKADPEIEFDIKKICGVGHRVVHGGDFIKSERITPEILEAIEHLSEMAPLHNPASVEGIKAALSYFDKDIPQFAVFDTVFNRTMPPKAALYGLPEGWQKNIGSKNMAFMAFHMLTCGMSTMDCRIVSPK